MSYVFVLLFFASLFGLVRPFKGLKRKHFGIAAVVSFILIGVTAPKQEPSTASASETDARSPAELQLLEKKNAGEIARLKKQAAKLPESDLDANLDLYKRLAQLAPANGEFKEKLAGFNERIEARARYDDKPGEALSLGKVNWSTDGFGSIMMINSVTVSNDAPFDVKDFTVECNHYAPSGTQIDSNTRTIFEIVPAKGSKTIRRFNMGFISSQAESTSCGVTRAKKA